MLRLLLTLAVASFTLASAAAQAQGLASHIVSEARANQVGLTRAWLSRVQVDPGRGRVAAVVIEGNTLFAQTDQAIVQALDAETGRTLWTAQIGNPRYPTLAPAASDRFVACTNGSTLYVLDRTRGELLWSHKLKGAPSAGAAANQDHAYIPMIDGSIEVYKFVRVNAVDENAAIVFGKGQPLQAPLATEKRLMWGTAAGYVFSDSLVNSQVRFRVKADGPVVAQLAYRPPLLVFGSKDGYLYAINELNGSLIWKFSAGAAIVEQPVAVEGAVYALADSGGLFRLDPLSGRETWYAAGVKKFLAASAQRLYAADYVGRLLVLDALSGARLATLATEALDLKVCNTRTDRIYVGTTTGVLQCLRERELTAPLKHGPAAEASPAPAARPAAAPAGGDQPAATPDGASPFGTP